jgi:hypothetical protein
VIAGIIPDHGVMKDSIHENDQIDDQKHDQEFFVKPALMIKNIYDLCSAFWSSHEIPLGCVLRSAGAIHPVSYYHTSL